MANTVIVVEHDKDMMLSADYIVDIGPKAGRKGGEVVFQGKPDESAETAHHYQSISQWRDENKKFLLKDVKATENI